MSTRATIVALTLAFVSCVNIDPPNGALQCGTGSKQCPDNFYCAPDNTCWQSGSAPSLTGGAACISGGEACASGFCVDGVCCDSDCSGQCQACDVDGAVGTCTTVVGDAPHGTRQACATDGITCGGTCNGDPNACTYPTDLCGTGSCTSGMSTASLCSAGACVPASQACTPFACDAAAVGCATSCNATTDDGCDGNHICNTLGTACVPKVTFAAFTTAGGSGQRVVVADFNKDTKLDFAVVSGGATIQIFLGNGDGTFTHTVANDPAASGSNGVVAVDVNNDGNLDLVADNQGGTTGTVAYGSGTGTFTVQAGPPGNGSTANSIATADFNGDTHPDFVFSNDTSGGGFTVANTTGVNTYGAASLTALAGNYGYRVVAGDFNGDGHPDIACSIFETGLYIYLNNGAGTFTQKTLINPTARELVVADMNKDGKLDILTDMDAGVVIMVGGGDGTFSGTTLGPGGNVNGIAVADFNGDGLNDVAISDYSGNQIYIYTATGTLLYQNRNKLPASTQPAGLGIGDFNNDGKPDIVAVGTGIDIFLNTSP